MSSPDPLNEATGVVLPPSSRRVTRSQRSQRFLALSNTPRKQTFELEVGDTRSPQRLLVTVQTEGTDDQQGARRKLFQSPSVPVVTRRVPLRNSIEDTPTTPKKRGRPRKLNGTPMPSAAKRRASSPASEKERAPRRRRLANEASDASTQQTSAPAKAPRSAKRKAKGPPAEKAPRRRRISKDDDDQETQSEASVRPIAKPTRRTRSSKSLSQDASTDTDANASQTSTATRTRRKKAGANASKTPTVTTRARRNRAALTPIESTNIDEQAAESKPLPTIPEQPQPNQDAADKATEPSEESAASVALEQAANSPESDIWMATLDKNPSPGNSPQSPQPHLGSPSPRPSVSHQSDKGKHDANDDISDAGDFMDLVPAASDVSSADDFVVESAQQNQDTIAHGEDFSMILMNSIPSMQGVFDSSVQPTAQEDLGDETSLIINKTLASLRQGSAHSDDSHHSRPSGGQKAPPSEHADASQQTSGNETILEGKTPNKVDISENTVTSAKMTTPYERRILGGAADFTTMTTPEQLALLKQAIASEQTASSENTTTLDHMAAPEQTSTEKMASPKETITSKHKFAVEQEATSGEMITQEETTLEHMAASEQTVTPTEMVDVSELSREAQPELPELPTARDEETRVEHEEDASASAQANPIKNTEVNDDQDELSSDEPTPIALKHIGQTSSPRWARSPRKTPMASPLRHQLLRHRANQTQNERSPLKGGDAESGSRHTTPRPRAPSRLGSEASLLYEDSFSEIPQHILDAAVPREYANVADDVDELQEDLTVPKEQEKRVGDEGEAMNGDLNRIGNLHDAVGPLEDEAQDGNEQDEDDARTISMMNSSPGGRAEQFASADETEEAFEASELDDETKELFEPSGSVIKSEAQAGWENQEAAYPHEQYDDSNEIQDRTTRPALSSIMKAGRMLQTITTNSQSPEGRDKHLGSPFRSTESRESGHSSRDSQDSVQTGSKSPAPQPQASCWKLDDPFATEPKRAGQTSFMQALGQKTVGGGHDGLSRSRRGSAASSMHVTPPSDDEMSWVAEAGPISPRLRGDAPLKPMSNFGLGGADGSVLREGKGAQEAPTSLPAQGVQEPDAPASGGAKDVRGINGSSPRLAPASDKKASKTAHGIHEARATDDDETDIWEFEAQREEPRASTRQQSFGHRVNMSQRREAEVENGPRDRNTASQRLLRAYRASQGIPSPKLPEVEFEDNSQVAILEEELKKKQQPPQQVETRPAAGPPKRFDFAAFFSPIAIPSYLAKKFLASRKRNLAQSTADRDAESSPTPVVQAYVPPVSTLFPQVQPRSPRVPSKRPAGPRQESRKRLPPSTLQGGAPAIDQDDSSPPPSEKAPSLPQATQDFTPQPRQVSRTLFQSSSQSRASTATTPPKMQLSRADIARWQEATSKVEASRDCIDDEEQGIEDEEEEPREPLRPLPPKNASPSKSSLRSPLKPRTPGRVVEFTSSVLSPADQATARLGQHLSKSLSGLEAPMSLAPPGPSTLNRVYPTTSTRFNPAIHGPFADSGLNTARLDTSSGSFLDPHRPGLSTGPNLNPARLDTSSRPVLDPPRLGPSTGSFLNPARLDPPTGSVFKPAHPGSSAALFNPVRSGPSTGLFNTARPGPSTGLFNTSRSGPPAGSFSPARPGPSTGHFLGRGRLDTLTANGMQDYSMKEVVPVKQEEAVLNRPLPALDLSQTLWSRRHWLALDDTLQKRRKGRFMETYERRSDFLLGRTVQSQGESLLLERWHLDCVDAFKARVGGWDESALAKRVAALIMGEERRKRGVPDKPSRVRFNDEWLYK
ncbi:hypothetical protein CDD81_3245 [Ophiocordyceps australis]|uniref:Uncharacterized protein n=1 Tax=Ophiocordyceps australis TaxID=1399860 RepID=A0A2C5YDQ8_9HYPO|nr:hypothetical protein CDD81_3245 [Ophiocordyceps australis]